MKILTLFILLMIGAGAAVGADCQFSKSLDFAVNAHELNALNLDVGAGRLSVKGTPGLQSVEVSAQACASSQKRLDHSELTWNLAGEALLVTTVLPRKMEVGPGKNPYNYIDLDIEVPVTLGVDVEDTSGPIVVERVAWLVIEDGSGAITVGEIAGNVEIDDDSGDINVYNVAGNVEVQDGSGSIDIGDVGRNVLIPEDSSGGITLVGVYGNVEISEDGAGDIDITDVRGSVTIGRDTSGPIRVKDVGGDFIVGRAGSGGISYDNVNGRIELPRTEPQ